MSEASDAPTKLRKATDPMSLRVRVVSTPPHPASSHTQVTTSATAANPVIHNAFGIAIRDRGGFFNQSTPERTMTDSY